MYENLSSGFFAWARFKPVCSATETSQNFEISHVESGIIILSRKRKQRCLSDCVDAQAGLGLCCSYATKSGFLVFRPKGKMVIR